MNIPVANWREEYGPTSVFWDLVDRKLRLYGPRPVWRPLQRQPIGPAIIFSGVISFGYEQAEVAALSQQLAGFRIAPIVPSSVTSSAAFTLNIPAPHKASLTITPSVPFPDLRFSATVQGDQALADEIVRQWTARTLIGGTVDFSFDMRSAVGGYQTTIDYRSCADWLARQPGGDTGFVAAEASAFIGQFVATNSASLVDFVGLQEKANERQFVMSKLAEILFQGVLFGNGTFIDFDNGEKLGRWSVHPAGSLVQPTTRLFVQTEQISQPLQFRLS